MLHTHYNLQANIQTHQGRLPFIVVHENAISSSTGSGVSLTVNKATGRVL